MAQYVIMKPSVDNVATAVADLPAGFALVIDGNTVRLAQPIAFGHKFAIRPIAQGEPVLKYGQVIGTASRAIAAGEHAHVQNIESNRGRGDKVHADS
ncbi:MAG TPA: UxaA family hydrolase [Symbiobacteriaceae bacterium]|nr:UxaA family hydrolase [Symbiobacteriaceae bacterium]